MTVAVPRTIECRFRTDAETKERAAEIYARWGLSLSDAINVFLVKSIEVGGLPFDMRPNTPDFARVSAQALKAPLDTNGIATLPADWDD